MVNLIKEVLMSSQYFVYKLFNQGSVVYVGQTISLENRIGQHRLDKVFDKVSAVEVESKEDMDGLESYLILKYQPDYNKNCNLDLAKKFSHLDYMDELFVDFHKMWKNKNDIVKYLHSKCPDLIKQPTTRGLKCVDVYQKKVHDNLSGLVIEGLEKSSKSKVEIKCYFLNGKIIIKVKGKDAGEAYTNNVVDKIKSSFVDDPFVILVYSNLNESTVIPTPYDFSYYFSGVHRFDPKASLEFYKWICSDLQSSFSFTKEDVKLKSEDIPKRLREMKKFGKVATYKKYKYLYEIHLTSEAVIRFCPASNTFRFYFGGIEEYSKMYETNDLAHAINLAYKVSTSPDCKLTPYTPMKVRNKGGYRKT